MNRQRGLEGTLLVCLTLLPRSIVARIILDPPSENPWAGDQQIIPMILKSESAALEAFHDKTLDWIMDAAFWNLTGPSFSYWPFVLHPQHKAPTTDNSMASTSEIEP